MSEVPTQPTTAQPPPRIDVISIFPEYLTALDLSLVGKARTGNLVDLRTHDLREQATDRHRTVDDAPLGGGAGMVMKPDVWLRAIEATDPGDPREVIVLVPTPSGAPLTQATAAALATELGAGDVRAVVACGRYEGIDARLAERLATTPGIRRVQEFSLGDYVLNGGEVAALVLTEAVVRLLPGVLGNPESVVEESFSEPLLEYPVYTRPADWDGWEVPGVLLSGHHAAIARWRRDEALRRTARRRPELLRQHRVAGWDKRDLEVLRDEGVVLGRHGQLLGPVRVRRATPADAPLLADVAAETFPHACPDEAELGAIRDHIATQLSPRVFGDYLASADHHLLVLEDCTGDALGYALVVTGEPAMADAPPRIELPHGCAELSKIYLRARAQGTGVVAELMAAAKRSAREAGATDMWVATNVHNNAAQRRYAKDGFAVVGSRTFRVGEQDHDDVVMLAALDVAD